MSDAEGNATWFTPLVRLALLVVFLLLLLSALVYTQHFRWTTRSDVARTRADLRSIAVAIETYYVDNMQYPAMTMEVEEAYRINRRGRLNPGRTFRLRNTTQMMTLTTPIGYLASYPRDRFSGPHWTTYRYYNAGAGYIVGSFGPDRDIATGGQLLWNEGDPRPPRHGSSYQEAVEPDAWIERLYRPYDFPFPTDEMIGGDGPNGAFTYDPTNGTISPGDIWRAK